MQYTVVFAPQAEEQLAELYGYIAEQASPGTELGTPTPSWPAASD